jgi:hypothetical protein
VQLVVSRQLAGVKLTAAGARRAHEIARFDIRLADVLPSISTKDEVQTTCR